MSHYSAAPVKGICDCCHQVKKVVARPRGPLLVSLCLMCAVTRLTFDRSLGPAVDGRVHRTAWIHG